jgi:taurine dioxygenase
MNFRVERLSPVLGAAVYGIDFRKKISKELARELEALFYEHQVLVFRDQNLSQIQQIEACAQFGEIEPHPMQDNTCKYKEMTVVSNVIKDGVQVGYNGPEFELWHSDMCYLSHPAKMTWLYAHVIPDNHNETLFADMYQAYEDLSEDIKSIIQNKDAIFGSGKKLMERCQMRGYDLKISEDDIRDDVLHPVVHIHPVTKRKALFINWTHTDKIVGFSDTDSNALLSKIYEHQTQPKYVYSHHYLPGDLIVWDNFSTLHTGSPKPYTKPRIMHRVVVKSTVRPSHV